jgi:hypothetical protein
MHRKGRDLSQSSIHRRALRHLLPPTCDGRTPQRWARTSIGARPGTSEPGVTFGHMIEGIELLGMLVRADEIAGRPQTWVLYGRFNDNTWVGVVGWPETVEVPSPHELDDLADEGWVRVLKSEGNGRHVAVTGLGRQAWAAHTADTAHNSSAVDLSWSAAGATLLQVYDLYRGQGAPPMGAWIAPLADDPERGGQAEAHIGELVRGGYLEVGRDSAGGRPTCGRPSSRCSYSTVGLPDQLRQRLRNWCAMLTSRLRERPTRRSGPSWSPCVMGSSVLGVTWPSPT